MSNDKTPLLFLHGWGANSGVWKRVIGEVGEGRRVYNLTLPCHGDGGLSEWGEGGIDVAIDAFLSALPPREGPVIGIGWSLGAQALMKAAATHPALFKGLVLVGATPCFVSRDDFPWGKSWALVKRMIKDMRNDPVETLKRFSYLNFTDEELKTENAAYFLEKCTSTEREVNYEGLISALLAIYDTDLRSIVKEIEAPTLIMHGGADDVTPLGAARYLEANIPGASLSTFPGAGHAPFITNPCEFNRRLVDFID